MNALGTETARGQLEAVAEELQRVNEQLLSALSRVDPDRRTIAGLERRRDRLKMEYYGAVRRSELMHSSHASTARGDASEQAGREDAVVAAEERLQKAADEFLRALREAEAAWDLAHRTKPGDSSVARTVSRIARTLAAYASTEELESSSPST